MPRPLSARRIASVSLAIAVHAAAALLITLPPSPAHDRSRAEPDEVVVLETIAPRKAHPAPPPPPPAPVPAPQKAPDPVVAPMPDDTGPVVASADDASTFMPGEIVLLGETFPALDLPAADEPAAPLAPLPTTNERLRVRVLVSRDGVPEAVLVDQTGAHPDRVTRSLQALRDMRFSPALRSGLPTAAWLDLSLPLLEA